MRTDSSILLSVRGADGERRLQRGCVVHTEGDQFAAEFIGSVELTCQGETVVLYQEGPSFLQQAVLVEACVHDGLTTRVVSRKVGPPVSAQERECYRAPAYGRVVLCKLGAEVDCRVLDVSLIGLGVMASSRYALHSTVPCVIRVAGVDYRGRVAIQFIDERFKSTVRYGLHCIDEEGTPLREGLRLLNLELQREQLARLAGSGYVGSTTPSLPSNS